MFSFALLNAIFEIVAVVRELFGHPVSAARHIATEDWPKCHDLADLKLVRRHQIPQLPTVGSIRLTRLSTCQCPGGHAADARTCHVRLWAVRTTDVIPTRKLIGLQPDCCIHQFRGEAALAARLPVVLTSGQPRERVRALPPLVAYVPKPWQPLSVLVVAEQALAYAQGARGKETPLGRLGGPRGPSVCERKERSALRGVPAREWPAQDSRHGRSMPVLWQVSSGA
jgi:hypothetical protein